MSQSYHAPGRLADHMEYDVEFANHLEEALMKRQSQASDNAEPDPEFGSHLEEALMRRRSQPPGHFLPTKEVLIDFGTLSDFILIDFGLHLLFQSVCLMKLSV